MDATSTLDRTEPVAPARPYPTRLLRWLVALLLVAVGLVLVGFAFGWPGLPRTPGDGSAEVGFARDMTAHHEQAVEMAQLISTRTEDPLVRGLAMDIMLTQQGQIGQMFGWLELWDAAPTGDGPRMAWMDHPTDGPMPGMATRDELRNLEQLSGVDADREFLRLMIRHHQGAAPMAEAIQDRSDNEAVDRFAGWVAESQASEVEAMTRLLEQKGGGAA